MEQGVDFLTGERGELLTGANINQFTYSTVTVRA